MTESEGNINETIRNLWAIVVRRRWWFGVGASAVAILAAVVLLKLPNHYAAEATLLVVTPQVSKDFVEPTNPAPAADVVQALKVEILSRETLLALAEEFDLYPEDRAQIPEDQLVALVETAIEIDPLEFASGRGDLRTFRISFTADTPELAQSVTRRLTSIFLQRTTEAYGDKASATTSFLSEELNAARRRMNDQEQRLQLFRMRNSGTLPQQSPTNLMALSDLRNQLQRVNTDRSRIQTQRQGLETTIASNLSRAESERSNLTKSFTNNHPTVVKKSEEVAAWRALAGMLSGGSSDIPVAMLADPAVAQLKTQIATAASELSQLSREETRIQSEMGRYESRIDAAPVREQELATLERDYDIYTDEYTKLVASQRKAQMTSNLEDKEATEHFRLVRPPTLPLRPSSPNRMKLGLLGFGAALAIGVALILLAEVRDQTFHSESELRKQYAVPLILAIPNAVSPRQEFRRKAFAVTQWLCAAVLLAAVGFAEFLVYKAI